METQHFYHPLVAKTATISLLNVRGTSNLGFDATFIKPHKHKQHSSQSGSEDYRIKHRKVASIVAKVSNLEEYKCVQEVVMTNQSKFQKTLMIWAEYKCVSAIITSIARVMISQPKLLVMLAMAGMTMSINFMFILWRESAPDFPPLWFTALAATIPFLPVLLNFLLIPKTTTIRYTIAASILGQALGFMALKRFYANQTFSHRL
ncbi:unnamed protein product [Lactuca virosa]|uniref:WAT1-related protein n=1 Tax=Lactuca virosa TaxID=75947 RepID=A0AAU9LP00_9ASTR|nr:unnamed protein product [Lactuca virosa]